MFVSDPSSKRCHPSELEAEGAGAPDRLWRQVGSRGPQPSENGTQQFLQERYARRGLLRPKRDAARRKLYSRCYNTIFCVVYTICLDNLFQRQQYSNPSTRN